MDNLSGAGNIGGALVTPAMTQHQGVTQPPVMNNLTSTRSSATAAVDADITATHLGSMETTWDQQGVMGVINADLVAAHLHQSPSAITTMQGGDKEWSGLTEAIEVV